MKEYNTTQLNPDTTFERHVFHRDQFAHYLRWSYLLRIAPKSGANILDVGCGSGNCYEVLYRNRYQPKIYVGLDIRKQTIAKNEKKFPKAKWYVQDLVKPYDFNKVKWDIICSFEVAEHVGRENVPAFLDNIANNCSKDTTVLISTPCYDELVGAAQNHIYNGRVNEMTYYEFQELLEKRFEIIKNYGTFASVKDYKKLLTKPQLELFNQLSEYYDSNVISVIFAPLFPKQARNVIWKCKIKQ